MIMKFSIFALQFGFFAMVLFQYYGPRLFRRADSIGYAVTLILYAIVYVALGNLFRAFKITDYSIAETIFSQFLSFGMADLLLYGEFCMIRHNYVNLIPGILTVLCQLLAAACWALVGKRFTIAFGKPEKTLVIFGADNVNEFLQKFDKIGHIFTIEKVVSADILKGDWKKEVAPYQAVIFYEVSSKKHSEVIWYRMQSRKSLYITPQLSEITMEGFGARHLIDTPMMKYEYRSERFWYNLVKRVVDILLSLTALILLSPLLLLTALAIKLEDHGPVFYRQKRATYAGRIFEVYKFRSMRVEDGSIHRSVTKDDDRITRVGHIIRKFRIDELPQLINVLKSDMSIVGPRPEMIENVDKYTQELPEFTYRLRAKAGLTGLAQIYGRYNTSPKDKLIMDLTYIQEYSLWLDVKLILRTVLVLLTPDDSTEAFEQTEEEKP